MIVIIKMKLELKRNSLIIIPESDQDNAFIEDSLGLLQNGAKIEAEKVNDINLGFKSDSKFVLKIEKK